MLCPETSEQTRMIIKRMLQYDEEERISWKQLFTSYLEKNMFEKEEGMMDESQEHFVHKWEQIQNHFQDIQSNKCKRGVKKWVIKQIKTLKSF